MRKTVEPAVINEEVVFHIPHHALHFPFGPGPVRPGGAGDKAVVLRQRLEAGVEDNLTAIIVFEHRGLLVINQYGFHAAAEVTERLHQRLVSVLRILARRGEHMEAA